MKFPADDFSTHQSGIEVTVAGANSILPKEVGSTFYSLHILHHLEKDVCAVASWDSSIHDSAHLNKITERELSSGVLLGIKSCFRSDGTCLHDFKNHSQVITSGSNGFSTQKAISFKHL